VRVVSWNLANRAGDAARREGEFLANLEPAPNLMMLQEVTSPARDVPIGVCLASREVNVLHS
jgi:hypothetical protein